MGGGCPEDVNAGLEFISSTSYLKSADFLAKIMNFWSIGDALFGDGCCCWLEGERIIVRCCSCVAFDGDDDEGERESGRSPLASERSGFGLFLFGRVWSRDPPLASSSRSFELRPKTRNFQLNCKLFEWLSTYTSCGGFETKF